MSLTWILWAWAMFLGLSALPCTNLTEKIIKTRKNSQDNESPERQPGRERRSMRLFLEGLSNALTTEHGFDSVNVAIGSDERRNTENPTETTQPMDGKEEIVRRKLKGEIKSFKTGRVGKNPSSLYLQMTFDLLNNEMENNTRSNLRSLRNEDIEGELVLRTRGKRERKRLGHLPGNFKRRMLTARAKSRSNYHGDSILKYLNQELMHGIQSRHDNSYFRPMNTPMMFSPELFKENHVVEQHPYAPDIFPTLSGKFSISFLPLGPFEMSPLEKPVYFFTPVLMSSEEERQDQSFLGDSLRYVELPKRLPIKETEESEIRHEFHRDSGDRLREEKFRKNYRSMVSG